MIYIAIAIVGMWMLTKLQDEAHKKRERGSVDSTKVKQLSFEWENISNDLAVVQHAFDAEQIAYNHAVQSLSHQRSLYANAYAELSETKMQISDCLRSNKLDVDEFKDLSHECVQGYLVYENEQQNFADMENDFNKAYNDWDEKCELRLTKIREMRQRIREIETEIKTLCSKV